MRLQDLSRFLCRTMHRMSLEKITSQRVVNHLVYNLFQQTMPTNK